MQIYWKKIKKTILLIRSICLIYFYFLPKNFQRREQSRMKLYEELKRNQLGATMHFGSFDHMPSEEELHRAAGQVEEQMFLATKIANTYANRVAAKVLRKMKFFLAKFWKSKIFQIFQIFFRLLTLQKTNFQFSLFLISKKN